MSSYHHTNNRLPRTAVRLLLGGDETFLWPSPQISRTAQVADWFAREIRAGHLISGEKLPTSRS